MVSLAITDLDTVDVFEVVDRRLMSGAETGLCHFFQNMDTTSAAKTNHMG